MKRTQIHEVTTHFLLYEVHNNTHNEIGAIGHRDKIHETKCLKTPMCIMPGSQRFAPSRMPL